MKVIATLYHVSGVQKRPVYDEREELAPTEDFLCYWKPSRLLICLLLSFSCNPDPEATGKPSCSQNTFP